MSPFEVATIVIVLAAGLGYANQKILRLTVGAFLAFWRRLPPWRLSTALLTWGGLRGGVSVALALSLPASPAKTFLLAATYLVVLFAVVIQEPTVDPLLNRFDPK